MIPVFKKFRNPCDWRLSSREGKLFFGLLFFFLNLSLSNLQAEDLTATNKTAGAWTEVQKRFKGVQKFESEFTQEVQQELLADLPPPARGRIQVQKTPRLSLCWSYEFPKARAIHFDGKSWWMIEDKASKEALKVEGSQPEQSRPEKNHSRKNNADGLHSKEAPAEKNSPEKIKSWSGCEWSSEIASFRSREPLPVSDQLSLDQSFSFLWGGEHPDLMLEKMTSTHFRVKPKDPQNAGFQQVEVRVKDGLVQEAELSDLLEGKTRYVFSNWKLQ
jgi:outer membrane lipoprotein-sorting protein